MVFRSEGEFDRVAADGRADGASYGWTCHASLALLGSEDRQECLSYLGQSRESPPQSPPPPSTFHECPNKGLTNCSILKWLFVKESILLVFVEHKRDQWAVSKTAGVIC